MHSKINGNETSAFKARNSNQHLRIAMFSDDFLPAGTGVGTHLQTLSQSLVDLGHEVLIITARAPGQPQKESRPGLTVVRLPSIEIVGFRQVISTPSRVRNLLIDFRADLIHLHYLSPLMAMALFASRKLGIPALHTYHMTEEHLTQPVFMRPIRPLVRRLVSWAVRRCHWVILPSAGLKADVSRHFDSGSEIEHLTTITNPIGAHFFERIDTASEREPSVPSPVTSLTHRPFEILYVGRLNREKNIPLLIRAVAEAKLKTKRELRLKIIGKGTDRPDLEHLVRQLGLTESVEFVGFLKPEDLIPYYQRCDVFVLPSFFETQGLVALEAMLFKKPTIVTHTIVSARDLVDHEKSGFIVSATDPSDLARRLVQLSAEPALCVAMGQRGFAIAEKCRPETVARDTIEVYRHVVNENRTASDQSRPTATASPTCA